MSDPITNITFGQRVAAVANSVGSTTAEWAGRSVTWIQNAAVATWGAIVSVVAAIWHAIASAACGTGAWLLANSWQAAIVVTIGVGIGIAVAALYNRYVAEAAQPDDVLLATQLENQQLRDLLAQVVAHPEQALDQNAELLAHLQALAPAPALEQPGDVDGAAEEEVVVPGPDGQNNADNVA